MKAWQHFKKICTHKWWVFYYCCKAGIPWRGFMHDWSKFSPTEFWESVKYYQGNRSPIDACKEDIGYSKAWLHHKGRNKHHYEYWIDNFDNGGEPLQMPYKDAVEMLCDYLGAGRAYMGKNFSLQAEYDWWLKKSAKPLAMHQHTRTFIHRVLCTMAHEEQLYKRNAVESVNLTPSALKWEYRDIEIKAMAREKGIYG